MIKTIILFFLLTSSLFAETFYTANFGSRTTGVDALVRIDAVGPGSVLSKIMVSSCSATAGATMSVYNSSGQAANQLALLQLSTTSAAGPLSGGCVRTYNFDLLLSSGLTYSVSNGAEILMLLLRNYQD